MDNYEIFMQLTKADEWDYCAELEQLGEQLSYEPIRHKRTRRSRKEEQEDE